MRVYLLILLLTFFSCEKKNSSGHEANTAMNEFDSIQVQSTIEDEENEIDYGQLRKKFIFAYDKVLKIDTTIFVGESVFQVHFKYYCTFDNGVNIPSEYIWEGAEDKFVTHNFISEIEILKNDLVIYSSTIEKEKFNSLLTDILKNYGVLLFPSFRGFNEDTKDLLFHYSISIPVTDIGTSANLYIDIEGNERIRQY